MDERLISILGCGWLGFPLAQRLVGMGLSVKGSSTEKGMLCQLASAHITPFLIKADPELTGKEIDRFFQSKILVLNIPFRRDLQDPAHYKRQIDAVRSAVRSSPIEFIIFTSSTSVYPETGKVAREDIPIVPDGPRAKVLMEIEQDLLGESMFQATVLRLAGLYGGSRQIGRIMAGRKGLADGEAPVNLVHVEDCIEIIIRIIEDDVRGEIFNVCSDGHPARKDLYTKAALHYGLEPPRFREGPSDRIKVVDNSKIKDRLRYVFRHPDPLHFL